jgi:stage II sporulation protein D
MMNFRTVQHEGSEIQHLSFIIHRQVVLMFRGISIPVSVLRSARVVTAGGAVLGLAVFGAKTPPEAPPPERPAPVLVPVRPAAFHNDPGTIQPSEMLALSGRRAPEASFRVLLTDPLTDGALRVTCTSGLLIEDAASHALIAQVPGGAKYSVFLSPDGRALSGPGGTDLPAAKIRIEPVSPDTPMDLGKRSYLGALEVGLGDNGLDVVNEVRQEDYIVGVVAGEAARSVPREALKAQAVAARTYALSQMGNRGPNVDVVDTVADQVYTGAGVAWPEVREAVAATAGQVLTYKGKPIIAYFSADCGGATRTNTAAGLGSGPLPYLKPVKDVDANGVDYCAASPSHTWSRRLTSADMLPKLNAAWGTDIESLQTIRLTRVYSDGRVGEVSVAGLGPLPPPPLKVAKAPEPVPGGGEEAPSKDAAKTPAPLRAALKAAAEATPPAKADETPAAPDAAPKDTAEDAAPAAGPPKPEVETPAPDAAPAPAPKRPEIARSLRAFDFRKIIGTSTLRSQIFTAAPDGDGAWLFSGRGYGHGVGMCQWGACGMAKDGIPYDRILTHYYTGVALQANAPRDGSLTGIAKDTKGRPIANAVVTLAGTDRDAKTDAQGHFRFSDLPAGTYDLVLTPAKGAGVLSFAWRVRAGEVTTAVIRRAA